MMGKSTLGLLVLISVLTSLAVYNWRGWSESAAHEHELYAELAACQGRRVSDHFVIESPIGVFAGDAPSPSDYPEPQFRVDCDMVCAAHWPTDPPGRTVMVDHDHLVCVCFRPGTSWGLTRYRAWAREQGD